MCNLLFPDMIFFTLTKIGSFQINSILTSTHLICESLFQIKIGE